MNILDDIKITVIANCVASDLHAIEHDDYSEIIMKLKSLSPYSLESVLEILNMHVVQNMTDKKKTKSQKNEHNLRVVQ